MVSGVFSVASLLYSLEQANVITHSRCPTSCQCSLRCWKQSSQTWLGNTVCVTSKWIEMLIGWETGCWEIDVCSQPCTERDGRPAVSGSSLILDECCGLFGKALSESVWAASVKGMAQSWNVSVLKGQEKHVEGVLVETYHVLMNSSLRSLLPFPRRKKSRTKEGAKHQEKS